MKGWLQVYMITPPAPSLLVNSDEIFISESHNLLTKYATVQHASIIKKQTKNSFWMAHVWLNIHIVFKEASILNKRRDEQTGHLIVE